MTYQAVVIETMMRLGLTSQSALYALPLADQFIEHTLNQLTGAYAPKKG